MLAGWLDQFLGQAPLRRADRVVAQPRRLDPAALPIEGRSENAFAVACLEAHHRDAEARDAVPQSHEFGPQFGVQAGQFAEQAGRPLLVGFTRSQRPVRKLPQASPSALLRPLHQQDLVVTAHNHGRLPY